MSWSVAGNLHSRAMSLVDAYPDIVIYSIGDQSHQSGQSDHNPDARSIVHAIDAMTYSDTARGNAIVEWCLADTTDLEYVIFNHTIWSRGTGFEPRDYTGNNPHTDHPHISGKHGDAGYCSATGTGYDTTAEAYRPAGIGDTMAYSEEEMRAFTWQYDGRGMRGVPEGMSTLWVFGEIFSNVLALGTLVAGLDAKLTALQDAVDELALDAGTSPTGAHSHGPDGHGHARHGAAPPA
jgi:hypothetical protein